MNGACERAVKSRGLKKMFCQICKKKSATVHYTELSGSKRVEIHMCQDCAGKHGVFSGSGELVPDFAAEPAGGVSPRGRCSLCGMDYADFKASGKLGCGRCYSVFEAGLAGLIKKIHGGARHNGKIPLSHAGDAGRSDIIRTQRERIKKLVSEERFEEAAQVRDIIRKLQEENGQQLL